MTRSSVLAFEAAFAVACAAVAWKVNSIVSEPYMVGWHRLRASGARTHNAKFSRTRSSTLVNLDCIAREDSANTYRS